MGPGRKDQFRVVYQKENPTTKKLDEIEHFLPAKMEICSKCEGYGTHLHESFGSYAYTLAEFDTQFDDKMQGEYFKRGGIYDVTCTQCGGDKVIKVIDLEKCLKDPKLKIIYEEYEYYQYDCFDSERDWAREMAAERSMIGEYFYED
jgi:hypothetical protein